MVGQDRDGFALTDGIHLREESKMACARMNHGISGANTYDGRVAVTVIVRSRGQTRRGKVSIVTTAPAPVEVEVVLVVVAIAHESVTATALTAIIDGSQIVQLPFDYRQPGSIRVTAIGLVYYRSIIIAEIGSERGGSITVVGTASVRAIHHVHCHTAVVHQLRHLVDLLLGSSIQ